MMALGFYALIPYLALHLTKDLGWSMAAAGLLLGVRQICQQGLNFIGGALADRFGWKRILIAGLWVRALGFFGLAFGTSRPELFLAAALSGFGGALFEPSEKATFESLLPTGQRRRYIAFRNVASSLAFAVSALLGTFFATESFSTICVMSGGLFLGASVVIHFFLPSLRGITGNAGLWSGMNLVFKDKRFLVYTFMLGGFYYLYSQLYLLVPRAIGDLGVSDSRMRHIYFTVAVLILMFQLPAAHWFRGVKNRFALVGLGSLLLASGIVAFGAASTIGHCFWGAFLFSLGAVTATPVIFELVPFFAPKGRLGTYYGFNAYAQGIGGALSTTVGGWSYDARPELGAALPWVICAGVGVMVFAGMFFLGISVREASRRPPRTDALPKSSPEVSFGRKAASSLESCSSPAALPNS